MKLRIIILLTLCVILFFFQAKGQLNVSLERNIDFHHDTEDNLELHSKNIISLYYLSDWGGGVGIYSESKRYPLFYGDPNDKRNSGVVLIIPITRAFMDSRFYGQIANKLQVFGEDIGVGEPWEWWVPSLEIGYQSGTLGGFIKLGHEFNCASASIGINLSL